MSLKNNSVMLLAQAFLASTLISCGGVESKSSDDAEVSSSAIVAAPANMGRYCSASWPGGGWGFASYTNLSQDPCAFLRGTPATGTVERAGIYSTNSTNNVVLRCDNGYVMLRYGTGNVPLNAAWNDAQGHKGCIFTVSPRNMPIFGKVYKDSGFLFTNTGFDFARGYTVDAKNELGDPTGGTAATKVDWRGKDMSAWGYGDHDGWDINMTSGTPVYAAADGSVMMARYRDITKACPGKYTVPNQGEVFIKHVVSGGSNSALYDEYFVTFYAHFSSIVVATNQYVKKGDLLGYSGTTGCSSDPHLHFGTFRLTNTASKFIYPFQIYTDFSGSNQNSANGYQIAIDPHGFSPAKGFDPWAWRAYPWGALSLYLWESGAAPPNGNW